MFVLDASAVMAVLLNENGAENVAPHLRGGHISIINLAEVLAKAAEEGGDVDVVQRTLETYNMRVRAFRHAHALEAARLRPLTKRFGLGFGDRACLAQGIFSELPILTGDKDWAQLDVGLDIRLIR